MAGENPEFEKARDKALVSIGRAPLTASLTAEEIGEIQEFQKKKSVEEVIADLRNDCYWIRVQLGQLVKAFNDSQAALAERLWGIEEALKKNGISR